MYWIAVLGLVTGMRTMTVLGVLCWFAWLGELPMQNPATAWMKTLPAVVIFSLCALGEYVGDTLPNTPSRKKLPLVLGRLAMAIFIGCLCATLVGQPKAGGILLAVMGVFVGIYGGYRVRMAGARRFGKDLPMALIESAAAIGLAVYAVERLSRDAFTYVKNLA